MSGGLVGENVREHAALGQLRDNVSTIPHQTDRKVLLFANSVLDDPQRLVERIDHEVAVAGAQPLLDALRIDLDAEIAGASHCGGQRLGSAHAAHAARHDELTGKLSAKVLFSRGGKRFIGALNDALRADINPRAGGHLAVHNQAELFELVEFLPVGPVADETLLVQSGKPVGVFRTYEYETPQPACLTAPTTSRRFRGPAKSERWRGSTPSCA